MDSKHKVILRYIITGVCIGLFFPVLSAVILIIENNLAFELNSLIEIHRTSSLQWIINSAPLVLGFFSYLAGRKQAKILALNTDLTNYIRDRETLIDQLEVIGKGLEQEVEKAVVHLRTAAEIAQRANTTRDLPRLLNQSIDLISEQLGFYHVGIFLNDKANQYAVLQAANSDGGQRMLERGHRLRIGEVGIVGYVAAKGEARIALDVEEDTAYFDNPDLPQTLSEMALPLKASGKMIGVLDIQSTKRRAFDENDITAFQIIADSLSGAIEIVRLFEEEQTHLEEIETLHRQYLQKAWLETITTHGPLEYTYHSNPEAVVDQSVTLSEEAKREIQVPLVLRGQVIGDLTIEADPLREFGSEPMEWLPEELALIESASKQAVMTLENVRLIEESQRLVENERITSEFTGKVWSYSNIDTILRTALQELGTTLGATEGLVELEIID